MTYKITIEKVIKVEGAKYPESETVYKQTLDDIIVEMFVVALNSGQFKSEKKDLFTTPGDAGPEERPSMRMVEVE
jgi:hypothetical protein